MLASDDFIENKNKVKKYQLNKLRHALKVKMNLSSMISDSFTSKTLYKNHLLLSAACKLKVNCNNSFRLRVFKLISKVVIGIWNRGMSAEAFSAIKFLLFTFHKLKI